MPFDIAFSELRSASLIVDAVYGGGNSGNAGDDPISKLFRVANIGGVRVKGPARDPKVVVLVSSGEHTDWPDTLDVATGEFVYYGDNRLPGNELHATPRKGNVALRRVFEMAADGSTRRRVPPIFVFQRAGKGRSYRFVGLVVPHSLAGRGDDALVAVWHSSASGRYQNYRARFAVLDAGEMSAAWLEDIREGSPIETNAPQAWLAWREGAPPRVLAATPTRPFRSPHEQQRTSASDKALLAAIHEHFADRPTMFEHFAADIVQERLGGVLEIDVTRPSRDGGRDATGLFRVGTGPEAIVIDFAMEAKCYAPTNSVGVRELSRLISRLRHRQFGVLVTTSFLASQAYRELKEDEHPILVISGREIAETVVGASWLAGVDPRDWLRGSYPLGSGRMSGQASK